MAEQPSPPPPPPPPPPKQAESAGSGDKAAPPPSRSAISTPAHLRAEERLQDFARTGFPGYNRVRVQEKRRAAGGSLRVLLILVLLGAAVFAALEIRRFRGEQEPISEAPLSADGTTVTSGGKIDPDFWQGDISSMETLLFESPSEIGPLSDFGRRFADEVGPWADRLRTEGGGREQALAAELDRLIDRSQRSDFNIRRLQELREEWLSARRLHLLAADWLAGEGAGAAAEFDVYRDAAERVSSLVAGALAESENLSGSGLAAAELEREWDQVLFYLGDDLKVLRAGLPRRPPASASAQMLEVIARLDRVFEQTRRLISEQRNLAALDRGAFEAAIDAADEAAADFDRRLAEL